MAEVLGVRPQPGLELAESIVEALSNQRLLLILDNCEHVLNEASVLARRIAEGCASVALLATSREPLGISGERVWPVRSLDPRLGGCGPVL